MRVDWIGLFFCESQGKGNSLHCFLPTGFEPNCAITFNNLRRRLVPDYRDIRLIEWGR